MQDAGTFVIDNRTYPFSVWHFWRPPLSVLTLILSWCSIFNFCDVCWAVKDGKKDIAQNKILFRYLTPLYGTYKTKKRSFFRKHVKIYMISSCYWLKRKYIMKFLHTYQSAKKNAAKINCQISQLSYTTHLQLTQPGGQQSNHLPATMGWTNHKKVKKMTLPTTR